ncbi:hypothetical protein CSC2_00210 [Clostridium zeae]|uniref:Uncharacterized protein n=1 Tax=Clostridium zeae TaxID=2759022 RepID=A0ABQ1E430_9CLOT|nr:hypothetical protein [Clostridium zeae]GFZ29495.1 hypothetical protein CSC2_00210 [Clostridium zeae]
MKFNEDNLKELLSEWQNVLRLRDWDIQYQFVEKDWRKSGDVKINSEDKKAILLINNFNPKYTNLEELVIHELLHIKLWGMDQMIEELIYGVFGKDMQDPKLNFAYTQFMKLLENTTEDLAKGYVTLGAKNKELSFGKLEREVDEEIGV